MRPKHWVKSAFCLAALFFSGQAFEWSAWLQLVPLLIGFSFLSSGTYLINDVVNADEDARHPRKASRPVAAGHLARGKVLAVGLLLTLSSILFLYLNYGGKSGLFVWVPFVALA